LAQLEPPLATGLVMRQLREGARAIPAPLRELAVLFDGDPAEVRGQLAVRRTVGIRGRRLL